MKSIGFIEAIAADESGALWDELSAGMIVLRCAEAALTQRGATLQEILYARASAARVDSIPLRTRLFALIDLAHPTQRDGDQRTELARVLFAYGVELHTVGQLNAAVDVFSVIADNLPEQPEIRLTAFQRKGYACRMLNRFDDAEGAYDAMLGLAFRTYDRQMQLEAHLGHAKVAIERGNLPHATSIVDTVLVRARKLRMNEVIGKALTDRAAIAGLRRDPVNVILDSHAALEYSMSVGAKQRLLMSLACAFREVDHADAAREIAECIGEHGQDADMRCAGTILRYHLAIDVRDALTVARLRHQLSALPMAPQVGVEYCLALSRDHAIHGRFAEAIIAANRMLDAAAASKRGEMVFRAEDALGDLAEGRVPAVFDFRPTETTIAVRETLTAIAESVRHYCVV